MVLFSYHLSVFNCTPISASFFRLFSTHHDKQKLSFISGSYACVYMQVLISIIDIEISSMSIVNLPTFLISKL